MHPRFKFKQLLSVIFVWLALALPLQAASESIADFNTHIFLDSSNVATITETIIYDFGGNQRRGIIRDIPVLYRLEGDKGYRAEFKLLSVSRLDNPDEQYQLTESHSMVSIRIGDPNVYLSGQKTYEIVYRLSPVAFPGDQDIFRFDVTGNGWNVPIQRASARLETGPEIISTDCYAGAFGQNTGGCEVEEEPASIHSFTTTQSLQAGQGLTIEAVFTGHSFSNYPDIRDWQELNPVNMWPFLIFGGIFLFLGSLIGGMAGSYVKYRLRRKKELVIARYEPPDGFTPAEVGLLADNVSNTVEFTATLIELAIRGYIKIERIEKKGLFGKENYKLYLLKPFDDTRDYEQDLLKALFGGKQEIELRKVNKQKMYDAIRDTHKTLIKRLEDKGYYRQKVSWFKNKKKPAGILIIAGVILWFIFPWLLIALVLLPVIITTWKGGGMLYSRVTSKGFSGWAHVEGFKDFLSLTEKERLAFHDAPERNPHQFSELLPYAIALGVEKQWAKQFEGIDVMQNQSWYSTSNLNAVSTGALVSQLSGGLNSYARSNFASTGSTGSGGSFSGGGVGGGGGGSW